MEGSTLAQIEDMRYQDTLKVLCLSTLMEYEPTTAAFYSFSDCFSLNTSTNNELLFLRQLVFLTPSDSFKCRMECCISSNKLKDQENSEQASSQAHYIY
jgi:hypothetical protein